MKLFSTKPEDGDSQISAAALHLALNRIVLGSLKPILSSLTALFALFAVSHILVLPAPIGQQMMLIALLSSVLCLALRLVMQRNLITTRNVNVFFAFTMGIVLVNVSAQLYLTADSLQTTNHLLLIVGIASVTLSPKWFLILESLTIISWGLVVQALPASPDWMHFVFAFVSSLFLATAVFFVRLRNLKRLEEFHLQDVSQKKSLANALRSAEESNKALELSNIEIGKARDAADAANQAKSAFVANMSHEIRTPLNAVIGVANILLEDNLTSAQRENVQMIQTSGVHLLDILQDILDFAKIEANRLELDRAGFKLRESINVVCQMFQISAREKGLTLSVDIAEDLPNNLFGDEVRVRQVLLNLVGNAIKFTSEGEVAISVECIEQTSEAAVVHFQVRDTGIGLAPEKCEQIFEAFTQADTSTTRNYGGTGLGLAISARLIEAMEGRIWVESTENEGSKFQFEVRFDIAPVPVEEEAEPTEATESTKQSLRILLAEDNAFNQKVAVHVLESMGHEVSVADDGVQAMAALENADFDLLLLDIQMPEMDGFEVIERIRAMETSDAADQHLQVIALTAHTAAEDRQHCMDAGMDDYLTKPLRKEELLTALNKVAKLVASNSGRSTISL